MRDSLEIGRLKQDPVKNKETEIVEKKGLGHPDSLADGIAEEVSRGLCREYRNRFGKVLHHNTDEVQIVAGKSNPEWRGGTLERPIYILLTGRATSEFEKEEIPVDKISKNAASKYIKENFEKLSKKHVKLDSRIGETSTDLKSVFNSSGKRKANDTSFGVGHAPLSDSEKIVSEIEPEIRESFTEVGEDIKVMASRESQKIDLTLATAGISSELGSREEYQSMKQEVKDKCLEIAKNHSDKNVTVSVNTADNPSEEDFYLTLTGTSAENGDDGSVGRGNRVNGLITPNRSMSLEAASGKNPVTHVGKIYNLLSGKIAREIHEETGEFAEVKLLSQIGKPLDEPQAINIRTTAENNELIQNIVEKELDEISNITEKVISGELNTF